MLKFIGCLMQLIISPLKGWEDIASRDEAPAEIAGRGLYPLLGVAACSVFLQRCYDQFLTLPYLLESAVITFVKYFVTYFLASFLWSMLASGFSAKGDGQIRRYDTFIIYSIALLAVIEIIGNAIPTELSVMQFLPLFLLFIMWMGSSYLSVNANGSLKFILFSALTILIPPYLLEYLFSLIMLKEL